MAFEAIAHDLRTANSCGNTGVTNRQSSRVSLVGCIHRQRLAMTKRHGTVLFAALLTTSMHAGAAPLTAGNLLVYRVGDGSAALTSAATPVFLDEYTTAGSLVQSLVMPIADAAPHQTLTQSGSATSAGLITRSSDGAYVVFTGYDAAPGTASVTGTTSAAVNRIVGRVNALGTVDTSTAFATAFSADNIRAAATVDGTRFWVSGAGASASGGVWSTLIGATTGEVQLSTTVTNLRQVNIFDAQLYVSTSSGATVRVGTVGTGVPTTAGQSIANLPGFPTNNSPYAFFFADLDAAVAGVDTLYVADDGAGGLSKHSLVGGTWVATGALPDLDYRGLTGVVSGSSVTLYAVRFSGGTSGALVAVVDNSGYNGTLTATPVVIASAATNTAFRGVSRTPGELVGAVMRITEFASGATNGELIEFTNIGDAPADLSGWSFDDNSRLPDTQSLSLFGTVQPGESVILTEANAANFRTAWGLCNGIKVIGGLTANLGGNDEINLFDQNDALVDRLTYTTAVTNTTRFATSAAVSSSSIINSIALWGTSALADAEASFASVIGTDVGSPGKSTRAMVAFDPCIGVVGAPTVSVDQATTTDLFDLPVNGSGALSAVIDDPTDPAANLGIAFTLNDPDGDVNALVVSVQSSNTAVVAPAGIILQGTGSSRTLRVTPAGAGYTLLTVRAVDGSNNTGTYIINYAASAASLNPATTRFHAGASDASTGAAVDADYMLLADDENQVLRLYPRGQSGLHFAGFDFTASLGLTDLNGGTPREVDIESSTRVGNRVYWSGSHGNQATGSNNARPNRRRIFATDLTGAGELATLAFVDRYDFLAEDLIAWDNANGHGLGAGALGLQASAAPNVSPEIASGFNMEGLSMAPDGSTAYLAFRAPMLPVASALPVTPNSTRTQALIIPVLSFDALIVDGLPGSRAQGAATFGMPIFLDLGQRAIRSIERNVHNQYLISAGPSGPGSAVQEPRLFAWDGQSASSPLQLAADLAGLQAGGAFESIVSLPDPLGPGSPIQLAVDNGDTVYYADLVVAKDLAERRHAKFRSERLVIDYPELPISIFTDSFE